MGSLVQSLTTRPLAFALAVLALTIACGVGAQQQPSSTAEGPGGTATIRIRGDWGLLDLTDVQGTVQTSMILTALYDRLLTVDSSGKLTPYLARSWTATASKFTFNLRTDATCADGTPVTATIIANSLQAYMKFNPSGPRSLVRDPGSLQSNLTSAIPTMTLAFPYFMGGKLTVNGGTSYGTVDDPQANSLLASAQQANTITDKCRYPDQLQELVWKKWYGMPVVAPPSDWFAKGWNFDPSTTVVEAWTLRRASAR